jgi:glycosyltransferase involved in cell wall biosynthesis
VTGRPRPRAAFVFPNPRGPFLAAVAAGNEPDTGLFGQNHLDSFGIDAWVHDPRLTRRERTGPLHRLVWSVRELPLPWELQDADVAVTPLANLFPLTARLRRRPRVLVVNYGLNLIYRRAGPARRRLLRASLRGAAGVICLGRSQADELAEWGVVARERVSGVPLGIDADWFAPCESPAGEPLVVAVGKDLARDYATFAAAVGGLDAPVDLVAYPRNLAGIRLPPNVRARRLPIGEVRELYTRAACVVLPQHPDGYAYGSEGGGLTALLEALAMARPVVATARGILADYVEDGVEALLVPPADPAVLRAAIERVLGDRELSRSLGAAGRARVERAHTTRVVAERLAPLIEAAAAR